MYKQSVFYDASCNFKNVFSTSRIGDKAEFDLTKDCVYVVDENIVPEKNETLDKK